MVSPVSPEDQSATFVELFFDLVFVFSVTQVVGLFDHGFDRIVIGQAVLVFWLVWWAWTQFTWALNAADTDHHIVQVATLLATAVAFFMAVALPDAFHGRALWFAVPYVAGRAIGLGVYAWVANASCQQRAAVRTFTVFSALGLAAVLAGGVLGGNAQYWLWGSAIVLDIMAAIVAGRMEGWNLHPEHFAERHGLFVIIALGETLIVAASELRGVEWSGRIALVVVLAVALSCALWWIYFTRFMSELRRALVSATGADRSRMARDVYSLNHFIILCGVVVYAATLHHALAHPGEALAMEARIALALGILFFGGGTVTSFWRGTRTILFVRLLATVLAVAALVLPSSLTPEVALAIALGATVFVAAVEHRTLAPGPERI